MYGDSGWYSIYYIEKRVSNKIKRKAALSNIGALLTALVILAIGAQLTHYALNDGSEYWILLAIPVLEIGVLCLGIGPLIKPIRILLTVVTVLATLMAIFSIVVAAQAEANYVRYRKKLEEEENIQS